jgi:hypothetical protein
MVNNIRHLNLDDEAVVTPQRQRSIFGFRVVGVEGYRLDIATKKSSLVQDWFRHAGPYCKAEGTGLEDLSR